MLLPATSKVLAVILAAPSPLALALPLVERSSEPPDVPRYVCVVAIAATYLFQLPSSRYSYRYGVSRRDGSGTMATGEHTGIGINRVKLSGSKVHLIIQDVVASEGDPAAWNFWFNYHGFTWLSTDKNCRMSPVNNSGYGTGGRGGAPDGNGAISRWHRTIQCQFWC